MPDAVKNPLLRLLAQPLDWLYAVGSYVDRLLDGLRSRLRLETCIISIGNIAVGGSGKTPFTRWLAGELTRRGYSVGLVTRGYGGSWARQHSESRLVSRGDGNLLLSPTEAGDEAVWLAKELPRCAVAIGRVKAEAAHLLEQETAPGVILLDDGLQHRRLHRDCDIVVLPAQDWQERLDGIAAPLPRGRLRESFERLRTVEAIVLLNATLSQAERLRRRFSQPLVVQASTEPTGLINPDGERVPLTNLQGQEVIAFAGIARPERFFADLRHLGARLITIVALPDHVDYNEERLARLRQLATENPVAALLTTAKDAVKLSSAGLPRLLFLEQSLTLSSVDTARLLDLIEAKLIK